jgi:two-component system OmpR family sensor kinase
MNIETFSKEGLDSKNSKKIDRIDIAARTISNIYNDLTYVALEKQVPSQDVAVNLSTLIRERAEFFKVIATQKRIECHLNLEENVILTIDKKKITRLIDNLISNAIKYNKKEGFIEITVQKHCFWVADSGEGMHKKDIKEIFDRYTRFNESEGGFGLGLNIVAAVAREYDLKLGVDSKIGVGTKVTVSW